MKVFIQNEAGSQIKRSHNEITFELLGAQLVSRAYPFLYGFLLQTLAEDGLNVDCFVLTNRPLRTGQIVECMPVGLMEQFEDGKVDHNVLAVLIGESREVNPEARRLLTDFVSHVSDHVPGKRMSIGKFPDVKVAREHIAHP